MPDLGIFRPVDLGEEWPTEDGDFTPWLAKAENLQILSDALGLDLVLEESEKAVGSFRADIVCQDVSRDVRVVIENQLDQTDHKHLGQILTYAAGLNAEIIIWIAKEVRDEHRQAIDWFNSSTLTGISAFAVEVHLWKIDASRSAAKFEVIARPNEWQRSARDARPQGKYAGFWRVVHGTIEPRHGIDKPTRFNNAWAFFGSKQSGRFKLGASIWPGKGLLRVDFSVQRKNSLAYATPLFEDREEIEKEFGQPLKWELDTSDGRSMVILDRFNVDLNDKTKWDEYAVWMVEHLAKLRSAFWDRVDAINPDALP